MPAPFYRNFRFSSQQPDTIRPFGDSNARLFRHSRRRIATMTASQTRVLLRFQKAAVRGNYETGNQAFSMRLRFLTTRDEGFQRDVGFAHARQREQERAQEGESQTDPVGGAAVWVRAGDDCDGSAQ